MKAIANVLFFNAITLTLLYFGLNGVTGAYNIYATFIILLALFSFMAYTDFSAPDAALKKIIEKAESRVVGRRIGVGINVMSTLVLIWCSKFVIATFMIIVLLNMCVLHNKIDRACKKAVDQQAV